MGILTVLFIVVAIVVGLSLALWREEMIGGGMRFTTATAMVVASGTFLGLLVGLVSEAVKPAPEPAVETVSFEEGMVIHAEAPTPRRITLPTTEVRVNLADVYDDPTTSTIELPPTHVEGRLPTVTEVTIEEPMNIEL